MRIIGARLALLALGAAALAACNSTPVAKTEAAPAPVVAKAPEAPAPAPKPAVAR